MTNYEKIKFLLEMGVYKGVEVKPTSGTAGLETIISDIDELDYIGSDTLDFMQLDITPIPNPPKLLPVGTKVRVFEEYRPYGIVEGVVTIEKVYDYDYSIYYNGGYYMIPARAVVPVLE